MKIIKFGQEARDSLKKGIDMVARCVSITLGPSGRNAVLGRQYVTPIITNDGVTIAHNIEVEDEVEQSGVMIAKEAAQLTDLGANDGTTTTIVLLKAITDSLFDKIKDDGSLVKNKINVVELKKDLDSWCEKICVELKNISRPITSNDIYNVALVSGEYDWVAKLVADVYEKIGIDGYVTIEEAAITSFETFKGIEINSGYPSEYFINTKNGECIIENPNILVTNKELGIADIMPLVGKMSTNSEDNIIIVAPSFSSDILNRFNTTKVKTGLSLVAIKQANYDGNESLLDIASLVDATFIDERLGDQVLEWGFLGKAEKAIITSGKTVLIGGKGNTEERIGKLKQTLKNTESIFDKETLKKRIAYLSGGIAIVKVGAESQFEKTYFKLKVEDAIGAVKSALVDGVVVGGGLALKTVSEKLPENILTIPILSPFNQIQQNAGGKLDILDNVIDPVKTTISALKSAVSLAGMLITTEVAVAYKNEKKDDNTKSTS